MIEEYVTSKIGKENTEKFESWAFGKFDGYCPLGQTQINGMPCMESCLR